MPHHRSTPQSVLDAPTLRPDPVWITTILGDKVHGLFTARRMRPAFVGNVQRDLLGSSRPDELANRRKARHAAAKAAQR